MKHLSLFDRAKRRLSTEGYRKLLRRATRKLNVQTHLWLATHNLGLPKVTFGAIEATNTCNLHCGMCEVERKRKLGLEHPRFIELGFFKSLIDQFAELHAEVTLNFGGESLLHPQFKELLTYAVQARKRGLGKISWFDNATLLSKDISRLICGLGVDQITLSVDRLGSLNDKWRVGSDINVIEANIKHLHEIRGKRKKPLIVINKVDVDSPEDTLQFIRMWLAIADAVQVSTYRQPIWKVHEPEKYYQGPKHVALKHCLSPFFVIGVLADGRVTGCSCDASAENLLGNAKTDKLKTIWGSREFQAFRRSTLNHVGFKEDSPCLLCDCWMRRFKPATETVDDVECEFGEVKTYRKTVRRTLKCRI